MKIKKFLGFAIATAIASMCLTSTVLAENSNTNELANMFLIQKNACEAHEALYNSFTWDNTYIYPDDFGGDYIDYDTLHVQVTDASSIPYYESILSDYESNVVYDIVEFSYEDLYNETENFADAISEEYNIVSYGVDVIENRGIINVTSSDYTEISEYFNSIEQYSDCPYDDIIRIDVEDDYDEEASITAGTQISYSTSATLGGSGTYNGTTAFITAGHCSFNIGDSIKVGGSTIGTVVKKQNANNQYGDYAFITAASGYIATSSVFTSSGNVTYFRGYLNNPAVGTYLYKYGYVSKEAYGVVSDTGLTVNSTRGITKMELISGSSTNGDSGGPYRNDDYFCGVHKGSSTSEGKTYVYFTPYVYISNAGFDISTY